MCKQKAQVNAKTITTVILSGSQTAIVKIDNRRLLHTRAWTTSLGSYHTSAQVRDPREDYHERAHEGATRETRVRTNRAATLMRIAKNKILLPFVGRMRRTKTLTVSNRTREFYLRTLDGLFAGRGVSCVSFGQRDRRTNSSNETTATMTALSPFFAHRYHHHRAETIVKSRQTTMRLTRR
ncbi:Uncharacterized protein FWK35_00002716 [Aphis craccivora]|uniref:Uncharacterized protein n=1 Tax=Aphis craccivora TaxID=307492 RepID=A0A6G0Z1G2_APHCR|nr:Uncharacterized protein FWK35_00002716 [Aphis craccivora]